MILHYLQSMDRVVHSHSGGELIKFINKEKVKLIKLSSSKNPLIIF